jgi:fermentation-respiration switch protein FrsA (DUF1100 family)
MDDGVRIDASLVEPEGTPPSGGWPAIMMFHGLGGNHKSLATGLGPPYVAKGYAVFVPDARGHGTSGGFVSLDGPREVADIRAEFQWLAARPEVSDTQIGAWGISLGGGAAWNSAVASVPFKALETFETWSDLYGALFPQNLGKSGAIYQFAQSVPTERIHPELRPFLPQMIGNDNLPGVRQLLGTRSSLRFLSAVTTPSFLFQGRRDFAFDIDQAADAYRRLAGPKRLYVGDFGHAPSTFPGPDLAHVLDLSTRWYDRFLKGAPNGVDKEKPVQVASDPWAAEGEALHRGVERARRRRAGPRPARAHVPAGAADHRAVWPTSGDRHRIDAESMDAPGRGADGGRCARQGDGSHRGRHADELRTQVPQRPLPPDRRRQPPPPRHEAAALPRCDFHRAERGEPSLPQVRARGFPAQGRQGDLDLAGAS